MTICNAVRKLWGQAGGLAWGVLIAVTVDENGFRDGDGDDIVCVLLASITPVDTSTHPAVGVGIGKECEAGERALKRSIPSFHTNLRYRIH